MTKSKFLNKSNIIKLFINEESSLRKFFLEGRTSEIDKDTNFHLVDIELKLYRFSDNWKEDLGLDKDKLYVQVSLIANFERTTSKGKVEQYSEQISNVFTQPYEVLFTTEEELKSFVDDCSKELSLLGQTSYKHWREMKPMLRDIAIRSNNQNYNLYLWFHEESTIFLWAKSYSEIKEIVGTSEGEIRPLEIGFSALPINHPFATSDKVKEPRKATNEEKDIILRYCEFGDRYSFKARLHRENEYKGLKEKLWNLVQETA